ncbi:MAG: MFS transporter [Anaerolineae bacterium]|nr:MFS transporter [Anaerolineae bacterium]
MLKIPPALRYRNFSLLWLGLLVSVAGSQMQLAALLWHMRLLSNLPLVVSGIGLVRVLPIILLSPFAGLVADRYNRRQIMFVTQMVTFLAAMLLGLLTVMQIIDIWEIYALTAVQALAQVFDLPARQSLTPNLVPQEVLPNAFSLQSIAYNAGAILGPGLGGMVIGFLGMQYVYFINAATVAVVLIALMMMGHIAQKPVLAEGGLRANLGSIKEGFSFIFSRPVILSSMLLDFIATFFSSANTLLPFVARDVLHVGEIEYGWLSSAQPIGSLLVGLFFSQREKIHKQGLLLMVSVIVFGLATILFGVVNVFGLAMLALLLMGAGDAVSTIIRNTIRQLQTPDYIRGRMVSVNQIFFMGGPQLGEIEAGLVAQLLGVPFAIISGGVGCILGVLFLFARFPQLARYRGDEPAPAPVTVQ